MPGVSRSVGRYEILDEVGRGGMAIVFRARQVDLDRTVALKELSAFHASDPALAERFLRESRLAGSLSHPNIVTVHEYFEHDGTPYIAMEYIERGSLRPYVGRLSLAQVVGVVEGMLAGLAHAEAKGIVHRDIKPENVMVTEEGRVKIADFGIAKAGSGMTGQFLTATGTTIGTPAYMAPEQALGKDVGPWTDLYSLGVMAYEMLVGRLPFPETESAMALLMKHVNDPVPPPRSVNRDLDEDLATWIEQLLEKSPEQRIRSAADAWDELEETVIRIFGARWRREARLPEPAAAADTPRPLTPAPFSEAIPGDAPAESQPEEAGDAFQSFVWLDPAKPPPASPPEPSIAAAPEPEPGGVPEPTTAQAGASGPGVTESDVAESTEAEAEPAEADGPQPAVAGSEADEPARPETHERTPGFVTYGRRPTEAPVEPVAEPPPPVPEEASVVDQPEEWPATVAPKAIPAPAPSVEPVRERPQPGPSSPAMRTGPLVLLGVVLVIGAGVGWLVAPTSKRSAAPARALASTASNAALELRFPDGWRPTRAAPQVSGLELSDPVALAASRRGGAVIAGTSKADGPSLLPSGLLGRLPTDHPQATAVKLGPVAAYRYEGLTTSAPVQRLTLYAIPTTKGAVTLACVDAAAGSPDCAAIASTLRLRNARPYPLGPDAGYARTVGTAIGRLNDARARDRAALAAAKTPAGQARVAASLAGVYRDAAATLRTRPVSPADSAANREIVAALGSTAAAYARLATAAGKGDRAAYGTASANVAQAEGRVAGAIAALRALGYAPA